MYLNLFRSAFIIVASVLLFLPLVKPTFGAGEVVLERKNDESGCLFGKCSIRVRYTCVSSNSHQYNYKRERTFNFDRDENYNCPIGSICKPISDGIQCVTEDSFTPLPNTPDNCVPTSGLEYSCYPLNFGGNSCPSGWVESNQKSCGNRLEVCCWEANSGANPIDTGKTPTEDEIPPDNGGSDFDTCTETTTSGQWSCKTENQCTGYGYPSSTDLSKYGCKSSQPQFCCFESNGPGTQPPVEQQPSETCTYYGVSCGQQGDENAIVKQGSTESLPYKSGSYCGGTYHDVTECVNNTTGAKRFVYNRVASADSACGNGGGWCPAPVSSNPCNGHGGFKAGVPQVSVCGSEEFDSSKASQTGSSNPYCGKEFGVKYTCSDGEEVIVTTGFDQTTCDKTPWCTQSSTTPPGSGEACDGANNAVGGNCTSSKPICNREGNTGQCVAQGSVALNGFCTKNIVCASGYCDDNNCKNPVDTAPLPTPTSPPLDIDIYCPILDTDGLPNTCYYSSSCPTGYTLKSSSLAHEACDIHTNGANRYCCHKNASADPTPTPAASTDLDPACPNIDRDNKPNSCANAGPASDPGQYCPPGFSYKGAPAGDSACTSHRNGTPSVCCHQF